MSALLEDGTVVVITGNDGTTTVARIVGGAMMASYVVLGEGWPDTATLSGMALQPVAGRERAVISPSWGRA